MRDQSAKWILALLLLVGVAAATLWQLRMRDDTPPPEIPEAHREPALEESESPLYPVPLLPSPEAGPLVELPPLDDSDAYFKLALIDLLGPRIEELLVDSGLIDRLVATIDNLPRRHVAESIRPLGRLVEPFRADATSEHEYSISPENARRYEALVTILATTDIGLVVETYQRFYPLLQQAYVRLGYPDGYFNDRVIEVIDHLLATPRPTEPPALIRPHVMYQFADPELEALSAGQKLLLRLGHDNRDHVEAFLEALRERLTSLE